MEDDKVRERVRDALATRRAEHAAQITALEELAQFRLRVRLQQGGDAWTDVLWNALMTAITLMKQHDERLYQPLHAHFESGESGDGDG